MALPLVIAGGLQVAGGLFGGISGRKAAKKAAKQLKKIGKIRAEEIDRQADLTMEQTIEQQEQVAEQLSQRRSSIESMYSKSGLLMTGTPASALKEQQAADVETLSNLAAEGTERVRSLRKSAQLERMQTGYGVQALKTQGQTAMMQGIFGAASGIVDMYKGFTAQKTPQQSQPQIQQPAGQLQGFDSPFMNTLNKVSNRSYDFWRSY